MPRGTLIVFEGLDRAGKSTQVEKLVSALQKDGHEVKHLRFPGMLSYVLQRTWVAVISSSRDGIVGISLYASLDRTTPIGQMINSYLSGETEVNDHVIHLLFSANRWEAAYVLPI